jgi:hypothetical protein
LAVQRLRETGSSTINTPWHVVRSSVTGRQHKETHIDLVNHNRKDIEFDKLKHELHQEWRRWAYDKFLAAERHDTKEVRDEEIENLDLQKFRS